MKYISICLVLVCVLKSEGVPVPGRLVISMPNSPQEDTETISVGEDMTIMIKVKPQSQHGHGQGPQYQYSQQEQPQWQDYTGYQQEGEYQEGQREGQDVVQEEEEDEEVLPTEPSVKVKPKKSAHVYMFNVPESYDSYNQRKKVVKQIYTEAQHQHWIEKGKPLNEQQWKQHQKLRKHNQQAYGQLYRDQPRIKQQWRHKTEQQNYQAPGDYYCTLCDRVPSAHASTYNYEETAPSDQYEYEYETPELYEEKLPSITRDTRKKDAHPLLGMTTKVVKNVREIPTKAITDLGNVYRHNIVKIRNSMVRKPRPSPRPVPSSYPEGRVSDALSFENSGA